MSASGDDGGLFLPVTGNTVPAWVLQLRPLAPVAGALASVAGVLVAFGKDPVGFIVQVINFYIVGGVLAVGRFAVGVVVAPFDLLGGALDFIRRELVGGFGAAGAEILGVLVGLQQSLASVIAGAGPLGPPIAVGAAVAAVYLLYRLAVAGLQLIPGGAGIASLLGVR